MIWTAAFFMPSVLAMTQAGSQLEQRKPLSAEAIRSQVEQTEAYARKHLPGSRQFRSVYVADRIVVLPSSRGSEALSDTSHIRVGKALIRHVASFTSGVRGGIVETCPAYPTRQIKLVSGEKRNLGEGWVCLAIGISESIDQPHQQTLEIAGDPITLGFPSVSLSEGTPFDQPPVLENTQHTAESLYLAVRGRVDALLYLTYEDY